MNLFNIVSLLVSEESLNNETPYYCDADIKHFKNTIDLDNLINYKWIKNQTKVFNQYKSVTYKYNDLLLSGIECEDDDYHQFLIFICPQHYIIVGVIAAHPMIETSYVRYENSDGSGPDLFDHLNDPKVLVKNLIKYYHEFLNDEYH